MKKWRLVMLCGAGVAVASDHPGVDAALAECDAQVAKPLSSAPRHSATALWQTPAP